MTNHKNSLSRNISTIGVAKIFNWGGGGTKRKEHAKTTSDIFKWWVSYGTKIPWNRRSEAEACVCSTKCRCQSKRSDRALAENGGSLTQTEFLRIKTDILQLHFIRNFKNFVFAFEKRDVLSPAAFISSFRMRPA